MTTPPTPILQTTRPGSRRHVRWLNQPACCGKGEPGRRSARACTCARIVLPRAKTGSPGKPWTDASLLLVILHYLLKNNTQFIGGNGAGLDAPNDPYRPEVAPRQITSAARGYQR
jgi:hypothetical protein